MLGFAFVVGDETAEVKLLGLHIADALSDADAATFHAIDKSRFSFSSRKAQLIERLNNHAREPEQEGGRNSGNKNVSGANVGLKRALILEVELQRDKQRIVEHPSQNTADAHHSHNAKQIDERRVAEYVGIRLEDAHTDKIRWEEEEEA